MNFSSTQPAVVFAWYSREEWEKLRDAALDQADLDASFDEWELAAVQAELELQSKGLTVTRVLVESGAFLQWCRKHKQPATRASRSQFALASARAQPDADG